MSTIIALLKMPPPRLKELHRTNPSEKEFILAATAEALGKTVATLTPTEAIEGAQALEVFLRGATGELA